MAGPFFLAWSARSIWIRSRDDSAPRLASLRGFLLDVFLFVLIPNHMVKYKDEALDRTFAALSDPTRRALLARLAAHAGGVRHIVFGHIHVPLAGTTAGGIAFSSGQSCAHRFITDLDAPDPWWTGGNPCYRILILDEHGFRAYGTEVGEPRLARAEACAGP